MSEPMQARKPGRPREGSGDIPDCYVINLARSPERLANFMHHNAGSGLEFQRFEASDGNSISDDEAAALRLIKPGTKWESRGVIGVALSHRRLWEKTVAEARPLIVFEDDAYVRHDFAIQFARLTAAIPRWDIVLLGYNTDSLLEFNVAGDFDFSGLFTVRYPKRDQLTAFAQTDLPAAAFRLKHAFGICGYVISPKGAADLLRRCFPMDNRMLHFRATNRKFPVFSIDAMMNLFYQRLDAYVALPPLVLPHNDKHTSTISQVRLR